MHFTETPRTVKRAHELHWRELTDSLRREFLRGSSHDLELSMLLDGKPLTRGWTRFVRGQNAYLRLFFGAVRIGKKHYVAEHVHNAYYWALDLQAPWKDGFSREVRGDRVIVERHWVGAARRAHWNGPTVLEVFQSAFDLGGLEAIAALLTAPL